MSDPTIAPTGALKWGNVWFFVLTHLAAIGLPYWYISVHGFVWTDLIPLGVMFSLTCMGITAGYHRMISHQAYEANPVVKFLMLCFGAAALQNSALNWSTDHRDHHRYVDKKKDPYNINKGFFWAHLGWMIHEDPPWNRRYENVKDLQKDPLIMWEHKYYLLIAIIVGAGVPTLIGWAFGRPLAGLVWGGVVRLVLAHHNTFLINSAAHYFGSRPYSIQQTARQCWPFIPFSFGEAYHNYHHVFAQDYRNGEKWYHWDPTKWLIYTLSLFGWTYNLRRVPDELVRQAIIQRKYDEAKLALEKKNISHWDRFKPQLDAARKKMNEVTLKWAEVKRRYNAWKKSEQSALSAEARRQMKSKFHESMKQARHEWFKAWQQYRSTIRSVVQQAA